MISTDQRDDISPVVCCSPQGHGWIAWGSDIESNWEIFASCNQSLGVSEDKQNPLPSQFSLSQNYPNPFNSTTAISYQLSATSGQQSAVSLKIYNILGQEVKTLVDEEQLPGYYQVLWDGRDNSGKGVSSGVYFYRLEVEGQGLKLTKTKKLILLK